MADFGSPVAGNIPYNPLQQVQTLSGVLGLKQQQQALETGQYLQQSAQADAIQKQQAAAGMQALVPILRDPVGSGVTYADGSPTPNAYTIITRADPIHGVERYNDILGAATNAVAYKNSYAALTREVQNDISSRLAGVAADGKAQPSDVLDTLQKIQDENSDEPQAPIVNKLVESARNAVQAVNAKHGMDGVRQVVNGLSRGGIGNAGITGAGGVALPAPGTNAAGQNINRNQITGEQSLAPGPNPSSPTVAAATASGTTRAAGVANSDVDRANQVSANIQPSTAGIATTKQIDDLADQINSGKLAKWVSDAASVVGKDPLTYARQLLEKDLGTVKSQASAGAPSDQRVATILSGFPEATSANQTIHTAMDRVRGLFRQNVARGDLLNSYRQAHPDLSGFQHADDILTSHVDPLMSEFQALKTPAERIGFYKRNFKSPEDAQAFKDKVSGASHALGQ